MLKPYGTLVLGTIVLIFILQIRLGYAVPNPVMPPVPNPVIPRGFVELTGSHGITVLIGPLVRSPTGGYERVVILPGQQPFMVNTEPGVTPQEIANTYG